MGICNMHDHKPLISLAERNTRSWSGSDPSSLQPLEVPQLPAAVPRGVTCPAKCVPCLGR